MAELDYYRILGVPPSATSQALRDAYLRLVKQLHPDRVGPTGTARFQEIAEAYKVLSDPTQRRKYDRRTEEVPTHLHPRGPTPGDRAPEPLVSEPPSVMSPREAVNPSFEELYDRLMRNFTGLGVAKSEHAESLDIGVILTPDEATRRIVVPLGLPVQRECPQCGGLGGMILPCDVCAGRGTVEYEETVRLHLPPGVRHGTVLEVPLRQIGVWNLYLRVHVAIQREAFGW